MASEAARRLFLEEGSQDDVKAAQGARRSTRARPPSGSPNGRTTTSFLSSKPLAAPRVKAEDEKRVALASSDESGGEPSGEAYEADVVVLNGTRTPRRRGRDSAATTPRRTPAKTEGASETAGTPAKDHKTPQKKKPLEDATVALAATISPTKKAKTTTPKATPASAKKKRAPITSSAEVMCVPEVERVYSVVQQKTGSIGGNGYVGAIYGELTMGSMQRVVGAMKKLCELTADSTFIDIGSGLGKPNFHVAQDPGCRLSYGVELEEIRWQLAIHNLRSVLQLGTKDTSALAAKGARAAKSKASDAAAENAAPSTPRSAKGEPAPPQKSGKRQPLSAKKGECVLKQYNVFFAHGDIEHCTTLDPFTHVYQFDLGFPPSTMQMISDAFNRSVATRYFITYRRPALTIDKYHFDVDFVTQVPTQLIGSGESHFAYLYRRRGPQSGVPMPMPLAEEVTPDPLFQEGVQMCQAAEAAADGSGGSSGSGVAALLEYVDEKFRAFTEGGTRTRAARRQAAAAAPAASAAAAVAPDGETDTDEG